MWSVDDLIVAPATGSGDGPRAIVRIAGAGLVALLERLVDVDPPGFAAHGERPRFLQGHLSPEGLEDDWPAVPVEILHWPGPAGPLGGPLAELQLPASAPLVAAVVGAACRHGARLARGGEFTLRGFLAGRLDLLQAEAVLAVVDARSPDELAFALDRMAGGAGQRLRAIRDDLLDLLADVEAAIDFADETTPDAVPVADAAAWRPIRGRLDAAADALAAATGHVAGRGAGTAGLPRVVLLGRPNIGKSSLFNALVGRPAALVADAPGTTRDWLEAPLAGAGPACTIVDIAGVPDACVAGIDAVAADLARAEAARADVVVACVDVASSSGDPGFWPMDGDSPASLSLGERPAEGRVRVPLPRSTSPRHPHPDSLPKGEGDDARDDSYPKAVGPAAAIIVVTRCDLPVAPAAAAAGAIRTSSVTGAGIEELRAAIRAAVAAVEPRETPATVRLATGLAAAATSVAAARAIAAQAAADEAALAGHVRSAVDALGDVTGVTIGTDLVDRIFSRHCIGK
jgi:tRNA modification GTPase